MVGSRVSDVDAARRTWAQGRYVTQGLMGVSGKAIASYKREFFVRYTNKYLSFWI
jgi:hypothetical protein